MNEDRRLIEESLPIKEISEESAKEKSIREGNILTIHTGWSRKPLIACRSFYQKHRNRSLIMSCKEVEKYVK